jgi:hypothetical protein
VRVMDWSCVKKAMAAFAVVAMMGSGTVFGAPYVDSMWREVGTITTDTVLVYDRYKAGKVGIGTTLPKAKLHVRDSTNNTTPGSVKTVFLGTTKYKNTFPVIRLGGDSVCTSAPGRPVLGLRTGDIAVDTNGNVGIGITAPAAQLDVKSAAAGTVPLNVNTAASPTVDIARFQKDGISKVVINDSGNVGIGTSNPISGKLDVEEGGSGVAIYGNTSGGTGVYGQASDGIGVYGNAYSGTAVYGYTFGGTGVYGYAYGGSAVYGSSHHGSAVYGSSPYGYAGYFDQGKVYVGGNLGIGQDPGTEKLEVTGNAKCDTVKCLAVKINNWTIEAPDYVFEKNYKLRSLKDVEKHIAAKKYLPDVPSAAEMKKKGIDLAAMNMALLKKVVELTLYVIAQDKKIDALESKIDERR